MTQAPEKGKFTVGYDLSTVGTWVRILVGVVAATAAITTDVLSQPTRPAFWEETALWFAAISIAYLVVYLALAPRVLPRLNPWVSTVLFYGPVLVLPYLPALPFSFRLALTGYVIVSIVGAVFIRYGGWEVVGIPALLVRRRHVVYCPWNTVDLVDKAIRDSRWSRELQATALEIVATVVVIAVLLTGFVTLGPAGPLAWVVAAVSAVGVLAIWILDRRLVRRLTASAEG